MMVEHLLLGTLRGAAAFIGTLITLLSYTSNRRYQSRLMLHVSIGFGILTTGIVLEGIMFEFLNVSLDVAHLYESSITLIALLVLAYHLGLRRGGG